MKAKAVWNNEVIADSEHCLLIGGNYYFPPDSVDRRFLVMSEYRSQCPWKGEADYFHLRSGDTTSQNAAFHYPRPNPDYTHILDYVAFWKDVEIQTGAARSHADEAQKLPGDRLLEALREIPKTEIHLHLESLADSASIYRLLQECGHDVPDVRSEADLIRKFQVTNLEEFIDLFINVIQPVFTREDDFYVLTRNLGEYMRRNNIFYAEVFFAPTKFLLDGLSFPALVDILEAEAGRIERESGRKVRYLVDVSRSYGPENAMRNLELVLEHRRASIIGIGLGGSEVRGPARDYGDVFARARAAGLKTVAHAGEDVGPESIVDSLDVLKATRIGHGISAMLDDRLMERLAREQIPMECCPTSNVFTQKYVHALSDHPIRQFFDQGLLVTVNTDDPSIFGVELNDELLNLHDHCDFTFDELGRVLLNGLEATFLPDAEKAEHRKRMQAAIDAGQAALAR